MRLHSRLLALFCAASACECDRRDDVVIEPDLVPPYVRSVEPGGNAVPVDATFVVTFSEPVRRDKVFWKVDEASHPDSAGLALEKDRASLGTAFDSPPLSATQRAKVVEADVTLSEDRKVLTLKPKANLAYLTNYVVFLSKAITDDANNRLVGDPQLKVSSTQAVAFQTMAEPACADTTPPRVDAASVTVTPGVTTATFTWRTDEPGASTVEAFGGLPEGLAPACLQNDPACLRAEGAAAECTAVVNPCALADPPQYVCTRTVALSGLKSETTYAYRLVTRDASGLVVTGDVGTFTTLESPRLVLNELLVTTRGIPEGAHDQGKFAEIVNAGSAPVELAGWKLVRCRTAACEGDFVSTWTFKAAAEGASTLLAAGDFAIAAGDAFDRVRMNVPEGALLLRGSTPTLSLLVSSSANAYALQSPEGTVISTYGAHLPPPSSAATVRSYERTEPGLPDAAENWKPSQVAVPEAAGTFASPGFANGSGGGGPRGCTDTQPPQTDQASIAVVPGASDATVTWRTDEGGPSIVQVFAGDAAGLETACAAADASCRVVDVAPATCVPAVNPCFLPDPPVFACTRTAAIGGLQSATTYSYRLVSTDASGNDVAGEVRQLTTGAPPKLSLNEILPITRGLDGDHDKGKFLEIFNGGDEPSDLAGWKILRCADAACTPPHDNTWTLAARDGGTTTVGARAYAIAAGNDFDTAVMGVPAGVPVLKGSTATLSFVTGTTPRTFALASPDGGIVSRYQAWLPGISSGSATAASWERKDPFGAESADNWAACGAEVPGAPGTFATPGARNTVSTLPLACADATPPVLDPAGPQPAAGVTSAAVTWRTDENGPSEITCVKGDATALEACSAEGATCPRQALASAACGAWVDSCALPSPATYTCARRATLAQLDPVSVYTCRLVAKDSSGNAISSEPVSFATQPLPQVVLTEVLVSTRGITGNHHDRGKFVEILNGGSVEIDLAGWKLARCASRDCTSFTTQWTLRARETPGASTKVPPGRHAVAGGTAFDPVLMGVPADATVLRGSTDTLSFVTSTTANSYALLAPTGELVSKYGGWLPLSSSSSTSVASFERRLSAEPDAQDNWLASTKAVANLPNVFATPGEANTATSAPAPCRDTAAPKVDPASVRVATSSVGATVIWQTDEGGASEVEYVKGDAAALATACDAGAPECRRATGTTACTAILDACNVPVTPSYPCARTVAMPGLEGSTGYALRLVSRDAAGNLARGDAVAFSTSAPPAVKLALSEVFASPKLPAGAPSSDANKLKFIEIANVGQDDVDLFGWKLARCADALCTTAPDYTWTLTARVDAGAPQPTVLKAGGYAVVGGDTLDRVRLAIPEGTTIVRGTTATILGDKLVKSDARAYALLTPAGAVVSTYGAHLGTPNAAANDGKSFERVVLADPDLASNWAVSTGDLSASSGAANFATPGRRNARSP